MKNTFLLIFILSYYLISCSQVENSPKAVITNGKIRASLYLPDQENGYYRGRRFDWSGIISSLEYNGHNYFGQWFRRYSPTNNDAIMGPVEAFVPIGYENQGQNGTFLIIGVGILSKIDSLPYNFTTLYPIVNPGKWEITPDSDQILFKHSLKDTDYGYEYVKTIKLKPNDSVMVISHSLKNTGNKPLNTMVYDHNFFVIDNQQTGPDFEVTLPLAPDPSVNESYDRIDFKENHMKFLDADHSKKMVYFKDLTNGKGANYNIKIENHKTGAGVNIEGDRQIEKLSFWSISSTICPEPYIKVNVEPGNEFSWNIMYTFYSCKTMP